MQYNYIIKYPFSKKAKEYLDEQNIDLFDINEKLLKKTANFLLNTISQNKQDKEIDWKSYLKINDKAIADVFVKLYPTSKVLLSLVDSTPLNQAFANYFMDQLLFFLRNSKQDAEYEEIIEDVLDFKSHDIKDEKHVVSLIDVLSFDIGADFKLQYQNLLDGNIYFEEQEFYEFLSLVLKKKILKTIVTSKELKDVGIPEDFYEAANYIKKKIMSSTSYQTNSFKITNKEEFPPCFKKLYDELLFGHKLSHIANFNLAVFLYNVGFTKEQILDVFKNATNFDEKIAGYQISKIFEKKYSVANCQTLLSNGLCVNDCKVAHPLQLLKKRKIKNEHE
jgi:DNA primase large subunit